MRFEIGQVRKSNSSGEFRILTLPDESGMLQVEFLATGTVKTVIRNNVSNGQIRDPYLPTLCGRGFTGEGDYGSRSHVDLHNRWKSMHQRVEIDPLYVDCHVVKRWNNFQLFASDVSSMEFYGNDGYDLDKDLLVFGNRKYGPKYCRLVPRQLNSILAIKRTNRKLPRGVQSVGNKYRAYLGKNNEVVGLGTYSTLEEAENVALEMKLKHIKKTTRQFKGKVDRVIYRNLMSLTLEQLKDLRR